MTALTGKQQSSVVVVVVVVQLVVLVVVEVEVEVAVVVVNLFVPQGLLQYNSLCNSVAVFITEVVPHSWFSCVFLLFIVCCILTVSSLIWKSFALTVCAAGLCLFSGVYVCLKPT